MAEMPRDKARSVRDPLGDLAEAAQRRDRLRREQAEDAAASARSKRLADYRLPFHQRSADLDFTQPLEPTVTIRGKRYREIDNGVAGVLVPADDPLVTPEILAERRRAIERAFFAATYPIGGALDGVAALAGVPQAKRDPLLAVGAAFDAVATGFASRGGAPRVAKPAPPTRTPERRVDTGPARFGALTPDGQARWMSATVRKEMLGTGTEAHRRLKPPGWEANNGLSRMHLLANSLGGRGDIRGNLVTGNQKTTNNSFMKKFENDVRRMVRGGEFVEYFVQPIYGAGALPPRLIAMTARGSKGGQALRVVENSAGRPK